MNFKKLQPAIVLFIITFCIRAFHELLREMNVYPDLAFALTMLTLILGVINTVLLIRLMFFVTKTEKKKLELEEKLSELQKELRQTNLFIRCGEDVLDSKHTQEKDKPGIREGIVVRKQYVLELQNQIEYIEKCIHNLSVR